MDPEVVDWLREKGWNAVSVREVGLAHRDDDEVLAYAHRTGRWLLTADRDFLDERRFPPHRNPGVIIVPGGSSTSYEFARSMVTVATIIAKWFADHTGKGEKFVVGGNGELTIIDRDATGAIQRNRYKVTKGSAWEWEEV